MIKLYYSYKYIKSPHFERLRWKWGVCTCCFTDLSLVSLGWLAYIWHWVIIGETQKLACTRYSNYTINNRCGCHATLSFAALVGLMIACALYCHASWMQSWWAKHQYVWYTPEWVYQTCRVSLTHRCDTCDDLVAVHLYITTTNVAWTCHFLWDTDGK